MVPRSRCSSSLVEVFRGRPTGFFFGFGSAAGKARGGLCSSTLGKKLPLANCSKIAGNGFGHDGNRNLNLNSKSTP